MGQKSGPGKEPAEHVVKEIRRATRRQFSAEEKIRIVLTGCAARTASLSCAAANGSCRTFTIAGQRNFWRPAKSAWPATPRGRRPQMRSRSCRAASALKEVVAELTLENRLLKKSAIGAGEDEA